MGSRGRKRRQILENLEERKDTENWRRKQEIVISGEVVLEGVMDVSYDRLRIVDDWSHEIFKYKRFYVESWKWKKHKQY